MEWVNIKKMIFKPNPGMLLEAINDFDLDPQSCILIGDNETDINAGLAAKIGTNILISSINISLDLCADQLIKISSLNEVIPFKE